MARWLKDLWNFLWNSDSPLSWIVDLILAFIIVKWIFFPLLSLLFASSLPMVVVESQSMLHGIDYTGVICGTHVDDYRNSPDSYWAYCGDFYQNAGISKSEFFKFPLSNGFDKGDIMIIIGQSDYKIGDIIVFDSRIQATPIIHRIIKIEDGNYSTKGDHNPNQLSYEKEIEKSQIIGKAVFKVPMLGWLKLFFVEIFRGIF